MRKFDIPHSYKSTLISKIKNFRTAEDPRKRDFKPTKLDFGPVQIFVARHFGFCYGVENAIEIAYKTIEENPGKRIYLLSEMIHNPGVNSDLRNLNVKFIMDTSGNLLIDWNDLKPNDIVIIPAFGTTIEIQNKLNEIGIDPYKYNTTCPFVEKVWNRSFQLGKEDYTIIIHGKSKHEETRATFSHSLMNSKAVIVKNLEETKFLSDIILNKKTKEEFYRFFDEKFSEGFDPLNDLNRIGVVNQTTMLASETQAIADLIKETLVQKYGIENLKDHFADTRDTLCYATYDNQEATHNLLKEEADFAIVVGGYNSSNTSHIVELCEQKLPSYFISNEEKLISNKIIKHFNIESKSEKIKENFIPDSKPVKVLLTSGASCPDAVVEKVMLKLASFFDDSKDPNSVINQIIKAV